MTAGLQRDPAGVAGDDKPGALELRVPPVAVFLIFAVCMWLISRHFAAGTFRIPGATIVAAGFSATGVVIGIAGIVEFRRKGTTVHPLHPEKASAVVSGGIFRFTRNPMYLGLALLLTGWAAWLGNVGSMLLLPLFVIYMTRFQIVAEERALLKRFGEDFSAYRAGVRRWL